MRLGALEIEVIQIVVIGLDAVAHHFLVTQLGDDGRAHAFGDDVELAAPQAIVDDEACEGRTIEDQAALCALTGAVALSSSKAAP